jgi:hypothetical protein
MVSERDPRFAAEIQRAYEVPRPTTKSKMSPGRLSHAGELQELFSADHHSPALCRLTESSHSAAGIAARPALAQPKIETALPAGLAAANRARRSPARRCVIEPCPNLDRLQNRRPEVQCAIRYKAPK